MLKGHRGENMRPFRACPRAPHYLVSNAQKRIWIANQLSENPEVFNMAGFYEITGDIDARAFSAAFEHLVRHHDIFRTVFTSDSGAAMQRIVDYNADIHAMKMVDLSALDHQQEHLNELLDQENNRLFDMEKGAVISGHSL